MGDILGKAVGWDAVYEALLHCNLPRLEGAASGREQALAWIEILRKAHAERSMSKLEVYAKAAMEAEIAHSGLIGIDKEFVATEAFDMAALMLAEHERRRNAQEAAK